MTGPAGPAAPRAATRPRLRTRLALLHASLAFACGVFLLAMVQLPLLVGGHTAPVDGAPATTGNLPGMLRWSAGALVVLVPVSVVLGWWIAGRALRPLALITATARTMRADTVTDHPRVPAAYEEFAELADTFDDLSRRLHASFTAQRQFIANASHELRTPLTVQRTLLQLTLSDPDATADTLRSACHDLLGLGRQQEHLIDALLTLATGSRPIDRWERFDLADVVRAAIARPPFPGRR